MENNTKIIDELKKSYWMELETVMNYLANSVNLDGIKAEEIKESLKADVNEELGHAQQIADRIRELGGNVDGSFQFKSGQDSLQPPNDSTDIKTVVNGVIEAETQAIEQYKNIIKTTDGEDFVTQDLAIALMADEEKHLRLFKGFNKELEK